MSDEYHSTTLTLVRHGQARASDGSYGPDTPLSGLGWLQAAALAEELAAGTPPAVVYTSPLPRAVETATPLCERFDLEAIVDPRLTEFAMGSKPLEAFQQQRPLLAIWRPEQRGIEGGQTLAQFSSLVAAFCDEIVYRHLGQRVVVVAHGGTINAVMRWSLGISPASPWQHEFDISNASVTELEFWPRGRIRGGAPRYAALYRVGDTAYLGGLGSDF